MGGLFVVNGRPYPVIKTIKTIKTGIGFGCCLAMIISWSIYQSVIYALLHGILGWIFVLWYLIFIR